MRSFWTISCLIIAFSICIPFATIHAQRGGGGGRGGGRGGGGASGLRDLRPSRRSQYDDYAWEAQKLLEANRQIMRRLPMPLRAYLLKSMKEWDRFFPVRKQQFEIFFQKAGASERRDLIAAFRNAISEQYLQRPSQQMRQGRRRRPSFSPEDLTPELEAQMDRAFQAYVLAEQALPPGLIILALTGDQKALPPDLIARGTLLKSVAFSGQPRDWMAAVQTGVEKAIQGKSLQQPSLFEYCNRANKEATRTLAFYQIKDAPPLASKQKGYGKKCAPLVITAPKLEKIAQAIDRELGEAIRKGKSDKYIDAVVKPKLTPEALKLDKTIKNEPLGRLVSSVLMDDEPARALNGDFILSLTARAVREAQPDLIFAQFTATETTPARLSELLQILNSHPRYRDNATLGILNRGTQRVLLVGSKIKAGQVIDTAQNLTDIGVTLAQLAGITPDFATGHAIDGIAK